MKKSIYSMLFTELNAIVDYHLLAQTSVFINNALYLWFKKREDNTV